MDLNRGLLPTPSIPPLSMHSSVDQVPSTKSIKDPTIVSPKKGSPIDLPKEPMKDTLMVPPSSQPISKNQKRNCSANEHHKKCHAHARAQRSLLSSNQPSHKVLDNVNPNNYVHMHDYDDSIHILDPITINLDEKDTLNDPDDEYETIDIDVDLPHMLSSQLSITPSIEHGDS